jgi:hypothetical protein
MFGIRRLTGRTPVTSLTYIDTTYKIDNFVPTDLYYSTLAQVGDIAIFFESQFTGNNSETASAAAEGFPLGYTKLVSEVLSSSPTYYNTRVTISYKVITASDLSSSVVGQSVVAFYPSRMLSIFRPNSRIQGITASTPVTEITTGNPASQTIAMSGQTGPLIGIGYYQALAQINPRTSSGATLTEVYGGGSGGQDGRTYMKYVTFNSGTTPTNATIDMDGERDATSPGIQPDVLSSFYIKIY